MDSSLWQKFGCAKCAWQGTVEEACPNPNLHEGGFLCPLCGGHILLERLPVEDVVDIPGAKNMEHEYGPRFKGWYLFKEFVRKETLPIGFEDVNYKFNVFGYEAVFIIPSKIEFPAGIISYSQAERELGVFRFPRTIEGEFTTPVSLTREKIDETVQSMTEEDLANLLKAPLPLVFNAFKIPHYGFEYFDFSPTDVQEIERITTPEHALNLKRSHEEALSNLLIIIRNKIESGCNYLSILQNILDRNWKHLPDAAIATDDIIHI